MVDAVGDAEPLDERFKTDAAGYDEDQRAVPETLHHPAQPAQELVNPSGAVVAAKHSLQEDRQLINGEEHRLVLRGTIAQQLFPVTPPASGVQFGADLHAKIIRADLLDVIPEPAPHCGD
jgi:hypothetical protein